MFDFSVPLFNLPILSRKETQKLQKGNINVENQIGKFVVVTITEVDRSVSEGLPDDATELSRLYLATSSLNLSVAHHVIAERWDDKESRPAIAKEICDKSHRVMNSMM